MRASSGDPGLVGLNDSRLPRDVDVAIAGLGPVGATAALTLARAGLRVAVFEEAGRDAGERDAGESRASTFHPPASSPTRGLILVSSRNR